jgi:hypothetical protein
MTLTEACHPQLTSEVGSIGYEWGGAEALGRFFPMSV